MTDSDANAIVGLITITAALCCCCLVLIGGGLGAFFFHRSQQNKAARPTTVQGEVRRSTVVTEEKPAAPPPTLVASPPVAPGSSPASDVPSPFSAPAEPEPPPAAEMTMVRPLRPAEPPPPAGPIEADDIRAKLLALNSPDKLYEVQASGYRITIAPLTVTGYLLEISFDYAERVARFVETNTTFADPQIKQDARQVLEANGWTVRE